MQKSVERKRPYRFPMEKHEGAEARGAVRPGMPNSALASMLEGGQDNSSSTERLENLLLARQPQIPQAEQEADRLSAAVNSGSPEAVKRDLGQRMGADFSGVRFHTGAEAEAKAAAAGARAFTSGRDIYFGSGGFDPSIAAHELVHTVQQGVVDSGVSTVSAPVNQVQRWPWSKKKKAQTPQPAETDTAQDAAAPETATVPETAAAPEGTGAKRGLFGRAGDWMKGKISSAVDWGKQKANAAIGRVKRGASSLFDWAERQSGHQVDPKETAPLDLDLGNFFEEDLTQSQPESKKKWWQRAGGWIKEKAGAAKDWGKKQIGGALASWKRKNDMAVDQFNLYQEEYQSMPLYKRMLWSIKNPIARLTASSRKKGTLQRFARDVETERAARKYTDTHLRGQEQLDARQRLGGGSSAGNEAEEEEEKDELEITGSDVLDAAESGSEQLAGDLDEHSKYLETNGAEGEKMSVLGQGAGAINSAIGTYKNMKEAVAYWNTADKRKQMGDKSGARSNRIRAVGSGLNSLSSGGKMMQYLNPEAFGSLGSVSSVGEIGADLCYGVADAVDAHSARKRKNRMNQNREALEARVARGEKLSQDDALMLRMSRQGEGIGKADAIRYGTSSAGNFAKSAGNIIKMTGVGEPIGEAVSKLGAGVQYIGGKVADSEEKAVRNQVVNEEFNLDKRIERYMKRNPGIAPKEAKHRVLMGMGFKSGKRKEAFAVATINRIRRAFAAEQAGNQQMGAFLDQADVPVVDGYRNEELAADRFGLRGEGSLDDRWKAVSNSRDLVNPFHSNGKKRKK